MLRKALTVALSLVLAAVAAVALGQPAHAAGEGCIVPHNLSFGYIGTTSDGYTGVSQTTGFELSPSSGSNCNAPYEGRNNTCATFRLIVLWSPITHQSNVLGPWVASCWSLQAMSSGWHGWVHQGDDVYLQARNEQNGSFNPGGSLYN